MAVLTVDEFGCFLGKHEERLQVRKRDEVIAECLLDDLEAIYIEGRGISLSVDVLHDCAERGIPIHCLDADGTPYAHVMTPMLSATVLTRRHQLRAYDDDRGLQIAKAILMAKLANQRSLLLYFAKYRKQTDPALESLLASVAHELGEFRRQLQAVSAPSLDEARPLLLNIEGRSGAAYWRAFWKLLPPDLAPTDRFHRGATDPVNCLLNYGYGILQSRCWAAVLLAGLDPFGGFIHVDRPGRPSLVLDLQDIFRQPVVDRTVAAMLNKGFRAQFDEPGRLSQSTRRQLATEIVARLDTPTLFAGRRQTLSALIVSQARSLAVAVRGEKSFKPFVMRW